MIELVLSLAIATILLLAMQSSVMVAARAIPDGRSVSSRIVGGAPPVALFSSDLFYATAVTEMTPTSISFTVPDRDGDGNPETIRYAWSGTVGDPLTRQYNGGTAVNVILSVQSFDLAFDKRAVLAPTTYTTSAETLLSSNTGGSSSVGVTSSNWPAQCIQPTFPVTPTTWAVTRVQIQAKSSGGTTGQASVQIRPVDASSLPTSTILDQQTLLETALTSSYSWQQFTFANATGLSPTQSVALVIQWLNDTTACNIEYVNGGLLGGLLGGLFGGGNMEEYSGSSWGGVSGCNLNYYLYGTYTTPNPPTYNYFLKDVRCTIQLTSEATTQLSTMIRIVNEPQVTGP